MANVGGQAVLEGVMMRGPGNWAVAVRTPSGEIAQLARPIDPLMARHWALRLPLVRGVVALGESLAIGFRALGVSANYAVMEAEEGDKEPEEIGRETCSIVPDGVRTATAQFPGPRIITPSRTACPPTVAMTRPPSGSRRASRARPARGGAGSARPGRPCP